MQVPFKVLTDNVPDAPGLPIIGQVNITAMWINAYWSVQNPSTNGWSSILFTTYTPLTWIVGSMGMLVLPGVLRTVMVLPVSDCLMS